MMETPTGESSEARSPLRELIDDVNRVVPDLFARREKWLTTHKVKNELDG